MQEDEHCEMTKAIFGKEYREIHQWIDFTYETHQGFSHWIDTHHLEAIESKYDKDTIEYKVAILHVITDWIAHWGKVCLPKNARETETYLKEVGYFSW